MPSNFKHQIKNSKRNRVRCLKNQFNSTFISIISLFRCRDNKSAYAQRAEHLFRVHGPKERTRLCRFGPVCTRCIRHAASIFKFLSFKNPTSPNMNNDGSIYK